MKNGRRLFFSWNRNDPLGMRAAFSRSGEDAPANPNASGSAEDAPATADASGLIPEEGSRSAYERCPTQIPPVHGDASGLIPEESSRSAY